MFPLCLAASLYVILSVRLSVIPSNQFPSLFFVVLDLKCDINLPFMVKQKNFGFCRVWTNLVWVIHCVPRAPVRKVSSRLYPFAYCSNAYNARYAKCLQRPIVIINQQYTKGEIHFINISQGTKGTHSFFVFAYAKALGLLQLRKRPLLIEFTIYMYTIFTFIQSCSWNFYSIIVFDWNEHTSFLRLACMILVPKICNIHNSVSLVVVCKSWTLVRIPSSLP